MRKVLFAGFLLLFCSSLAFAQGPRRLEQSPRRVARTAAVASETPRLSPARIWERFIVWVETFDDPPPPPERGNGPVPG